MKRKTLSEFINQANKVHNSVYDYNNTDYINARVKVIIGCKEHGQFSQSPNNHLNGQGCPTCGINKQVGNKKKFHSSKKDWNFEQPEDYKLIPLTQGKLAKVDNEDFERVIHYNWYYYEGYAINNTVGYMHRYIMSAPEHLEVDHKNHDTLDNRKNELRLATRSQNSANQIAGKGCSSIYKGVCFNKRARKWVCSLTHEGVGFNLGYYESEEDCAKAYDLKALECWGEFAHLNFPELKEEYLKQIYGNF